MIYWALIGIGILVVAAVTIGAFGTRSCEIKLSDGTVLQVTPAPTLASLCSEASDKIVCRTKDGKVGTINLLDDSDSGLAMVMPGMGDNCLLFLYYADVHYRLMRVDLNKKSSPFTSGSYLNYIVLSSDWNVEEGTSNDWEAAYSNLTTVPKNVFNQQAVTTYLLGIVPTQYRRDDLRSEVKREINNTQHGWVY